MKSGRNERDPARRTIWTGGPDLRRRQQFALSLPEKKATAKKKKTLKE
jgi:hypothetical protein